MTPQITLAVTRPDAPLAIVWVALVIKYHNGSQKNVDPTDDYLRAQITRHYGDSWTKYRIIDVKELPTDPLWREAWFDDGTGIRVDLSTAKAIHRTRIAKAMAVRFSATDAPLLQAMAQGDKKERDRLLALREALQKAPDDPRIDAARSLDELKAVDPLASIS